MEIPLSKSNRFLPWIVGIVGAAAIAGIITTTYKVYQAPNPQVELEKLTVAVKQEDLTVEIKASGVVQPIRRVKISPKTSGRLAKLLVEKGMTVKQGQVIGLMENYEIQTNGMEAQANLKQAQANLQGLEIKLAEDINQANARVKQAQARLEQGKLKIPKQIEQTQAQLVAGDVKVKWNKDRLDRYQMLLKDGAIDRDRYNEQLNNYLTAVANKEEIVKRIEELNASGREEIVQLQAALEETQLALRQKQTSQKVEIAQSQVAVKAAEARLLRVKVDLENAIIRAPFDGIITQKNAEPGEIVSPSLGAGSSSIVEIAQGLKIEAKVPEVDISQLKVGQQVNVIAEAYPDSVFQGKIIAIAPEAIEEQNVTSFKVEVGLVNGKDKLLSKMNVDVKFIGKKLTNSLVIPTVAIVTDKGQTGVMIPDVNNKPKFQPITIGLTIDNQTQIIEGIKAGDRVYIDLPEDKNKPKQPE